MADLRSISCTDPSTDAVSDARQLAEQSSEWMAGSRRGAVARARRGRQTWPPMHARTRRPAHVVSRAAAEPSGTVQSEFRWSPHSGSVRERATAPTWPHMHARTLRPISELPNGRTQDAL